MKRIAVRLLHFLDLAPSHPRGVAEPRTNSRARAGRNTRTKLSDLENHSTDAATRIRLWVMRCSWACGSFGSIVFSLAVGCGGGSEKSGATAGSANLGGSANASGGAVASGASGGSLNASGGASASGGGTASAGGQAGSAQAGTSSSNPGSGAFRYGINAGYPNPAFNDQDLAGLAVRAGATSERVSLPEQHLAQWGYMIERADVEAYRSLGMGELVGFLTAPTRAHSTAPSSVPDSDVSLYIPQNLYEPITTSDGQINPNNYWASYVYQTVSIYGDRIKVWEIWNEPDWVSDWQVTERWATAAPTSADLPRFHGSVFDYVRMLRVSHEAARLADPSAKIATGGLGYPNFLDAVLRYTDEPKTGAIDADHPATGKAYIDVLSFHHYPIYTAGNSEAGVDGFLSQRQAFAKLVDAAGIHVDWECTETGAPHVTLDSVPSGTDYARNYLMKVMTLAQTVGLGGVHWFVLSDAKAPGASTDPYAFMGLYQPVGTLDSPQKALLTDTGKAYKTLTTALAGSAYDAAGTAALALPSGARGAQFLSESGKRSLVLWAVPASGSENGALEIDIPSSNGFSELRWDASATGTSRDVPASAGSAHLVLDGIPTVFVEK